MGSFMLNITIDAEMYTLLARILSRCPHATDPQLNALLDDLIQTRLMPSSLITLGRCRTVIAASSFQINHVVD